MNLHPNKSGLNLKDLGVEPNEDSPDLTEEEIKEATITVSSGDYLQTLKTIGKFISKADRRQRAGRVYSRLTFSDDSIKLFDITWIKDVHGSRPATEG